MQPTAADTRLFSDVHWLNRGTEVFDYTAKRKGSIRISHQTESCELCFPLTGRS